MLLAAANRDEARFANAEQFIPDREDNQHLGLLTGIHYCFGAPLARIEAQIALREFVRRFEGPQLVLDPPPYRANATLRGPSELMIGMQRVSESQEGTKASRHETPERHRRPESTLKGAARWLSKAFVSG